MSLRKKISDEMVLAMKSKDKLRLDVLRMALAKFKEADIEARAKDQQEIGDAQIIDILIKMIKQRKDSCQIYETHGRLEALQKEQAEIDVLASYLPQPLSEAEIETAITQALQEIGATSAADIGKIVAYLKMHYAGRIDFAQIVPRIKQKFN